MAEQYTNSAKTVIREARKAAQSFGHTYIGSEHLLLGLLREKEGTASRLLREYQEIVSLRQCVDALVYGLQGLLGFALEYWYGLKGVEEMAYYPGRCVEQASLDTVTEKSELVPESAHHRRSSLFSVKHAGIDPRLEPDGEMYHRRCRPGSPSVIASENAGFGEIYIFLAIYLPPPEQQPAQENRQAGETAVRKPVKGVWTIIAHCHPSAADRSSNST